MPPGGNENAAAHGLFPGAPGEAAAQPPYGGDAGATQSMRPVDDGSVNPPGNAPANDAFDGRPMFRDETVAPGKSNTTAEIDVSSFKSASGSPRRLDRNRAALIGAGFLALLVAAGGAAFLFAIQPGGSSGEYDVARVSNESNDSEALSINELFAAETIEVGDETFTLAQTDDTEECATTTHGGYGEVLNNNDCRQVVRASYVNEDQTHAVTVGVAAMANAEGAQAAQEGQDLASATWFAGLSGEEGSGAENLDYAGGHASGAVWGRYLIFSLAANSDGQAPASEDTELADISKAFVNIPLTSLGERAKG
ncbi:hypothetical protein [Salinactinospora qingdaonensis]|uniref:Uncharacterized protein n=1 Tax=Salinactinospora qingdaonensis TaxID=702744 RepID=A0ABP7GEC7_9ACTN